MTEWHRIESADAITQLRSDGEQGLTQVEAAKRLAQYGANELTESGLKSPLRIFAEQFASVMIIILILAALVSGILGDVKDTIAILAIVLLNALLGFVQGYRAERAMLALKKLEVPLVKVLREGRLQSISSRLLVPGDVFLLEAGNRVSADGRLLDLANLQIQEAPLTGESVPVEKESNALASELPLADRRNMVYLGTFVTYGHGRAVVTATGMQTELGRIASMLQAVHPETTPLQKRLDQLGWRLAGIVLVLVAIIFILGILRAEDPNLMFITAVSMAVAAVPEGLPAVVTIALALSAQRMLKQRALIRKLPAVETLGSVTVICSDKTGTLTENRMTVTILDVAGHRVDLTERLHYDEPLLDTRAAPTALLHDEPALALLYAGSALCNDAVLTPEGDGDLSADSTLEAIGDPTEGALVVAAARVGLREDELEQILPRVAEIPFDSVRKRMTTIHRLPLTRTELPPVLGVLWEWNESGARAPYIAFTKGAVESLLNLSDDVWVNRSVEPMAASWRQRIWSEHDALAATGMRVIGVAFRPVDRLDALEEIERGLVFVGMAAMLDPARPEAKDAVSTCKAAGIYAVMITGDHALTARHIASELGISVNGNLMTGQELAHLSDEELAQRIESIPVYARVTPDDKLKIVRSWQKRGHIVAMTGDGVNDAPALKQADIGVAMGITGTDVAKESADMVLLDDNFATIVRAVEQGRIVYDNIRKFTQYILTSNVGELVVMLTAPFLGMPLPLLPLQILWINLVTDGLPGLAFGFEPAERNTMRRPPYPPNESIFARGTGRDIVWLGLLLGAVSLMVGFIYEGTNQASWQTMIFMTLTVSQLIFAFSVRSRQDSVFQIGIASNRPLVGAVGLTLVLQLLVIYVPFLQDIFKTTALSITELGISFAASTIVFWAMEFEKWFLRHRRNSE